MTAATVYALGRVGALAPKARPGTIALAGGSALAGLALAVRASGRP
jgi:hypothetical protein